MMNNDYNLDYIHNKKIKKLGLHEVQSRFTLFMLYTDQTAVNHVSVH